MNITKRTLAYCGGSGIIHNMGISERYLQWLNAWCRHGQLQTVLNKKEKFQFQKN